MKRFLLTFLVGAAAGGFGHWYFTQEQGRAQLEEVRTNVVRIGDTVRTTAEEGYEEVREGIVRTGNAVRDTAKNAGTAIANTAADVRITAAVKTKLVGESGLAGLSIGVDTAGGVVTLTGDATDSAHITKAINAALTVEGVTRVTSKMQVTAQKAK